MKKRKILFLTSLLIISGCHASPSSSEKEISPNPVSSTSPTSSTGSSFAKTAEEYKADLKQFQSKLASNTPLTLTVPGDSVTKFLGTDCFLKVKTSKAGGNEEIPFTDGEGILPNGEQGIFAFEKKDSVVTLGSMVTPNKEAVISSKYPFPYNLSKVAFSQNPTEINAFTTLSREAIQTVTNLTGNPSYYASFAQSLTLRLLSNDRVSISGVFLVDADGDQVVEKRISFGLIFSDVGATTDLEVLAKKNTPETLVNPSSFSAPVAADMVSIYGEELPHTGFTYGTSFAEEKESTSDALISLTVEDYLAGDITENYISLLTGAGFAEKDLGESDLGKNSKSYLLEKTKVEGSSATKKGPLKTQAFLYFYSKEYLQSLVPNDGLLYPNGKLVLTLRNYRYPFSTASLSETNTYLSGLSYKDSGNNSLLPPFAFDEDDLASFLFTEKEDPELTLSLSFAGSFTTLALAVQDLKETGDSLVALGYTGSVLVPAPAEGETSSTTLTYALGDYKDSSSKGIQVSFSLSSDASFTILVKYKA